MQRITATLQRVTAAALISSAAALAQGNFIHDGRSAWSLVYGLGPADGVTAHALGLAYSAKGMFDFGYSYVLMNYDENPLGLGNAWGLDAAFHILKGSGDNPFGLSIVAAFTHVDAGEKGSGSFRGEDLRPNPNSFAFGLDVHKTFSLNQTAGLLLGSGIRRLVPEPRNLGNTDGFGIDAFIPFDADLAIRLNEKAKLILAAWYSLYLLDFESSSKGIGISLMLFPPKRP